MKPSGTDRYLSHRQVESIEDILVAMKTFVRRNNDHDSAIRGLIYNGLWELKKLRGVLGVEDHPKDDRRRKKY